MKCQQSNLIKFVSNSNKQQKVASQMSKLEENGKICSRILSNFKLFNHNLAIHLVDYSSSGADKRLKWKSLRGKFAFQP
jgi:hypothetical protein